MISIQVNALYLKSLRHIMAVRDVRYYLNGVYFECDVRGKFYVACDGHRLGVYFEPWRDDEDVQTVNVIIPGEVIKAIKPHKSGFAAVLSCSERKQNDGVDVSAWKLDTRNGMALSFDGIDGKYVDWQRVIPQTVSGDFSAVNFEYLADFNRCLRDGADQRYSAVIRHNGNGANVVMPASDGIPFVGVVMSMRAREDEYKRPQWLDFPPAELRKTA